MHDKKIKWYKAADSKASINWQSNNMAIAEAGGRTITFAKFNNQIFACSHKCPHASGTLADGFIDVTGNVVCPLHHYKFSLQNGRNVSGEGYYLKTFIIEERDAGIFVGFEENNMMELLQ